MKKTKYQGFSLIEILIVITVFSIISLIAAQAIILTLVAARKADTISRVRQNLDFAVSTIERQLHNAKDITICPNPNNQQLNFTDQTGTSINIACVGTNTNDQPASVNLSGKELTAKTITITACSFVCTPVSGTSPSYVTINITAKEIGSISSQINTVTQVTTRSH